MNGVTIALVVFALIVILISVVYVLSKRLCKLTADLKATKSEVERQKENLTTLVQHATELDKIRKEENAVEQAIEGAQSNEEVFSIINSVIDTNNNKLRK